MELVSEVLQRPRLLYGGAGALLTGGALLYRLTHRKKPTHVIVNCWFCNQDTEVPYGNRNCWDCPYCEQYNGFQENGDYNKPIPAQYMEHLNHGVSADVPVLDTPKTQQWVNCQMLLCKRCNSNQTLKIKQLASFIPRDEDNYDEEIEVYKHHLEQTYKLCRPCQTAVEYYIKHQNRQLRALLFNHQLRRSRDADKAFIKSTSCMSTPAWLVALRTLAFFTCAFLVALAIRGSGCGSGDASSLQNSLHTLSGGVIPPSQACQNDTEAKANSSTKTMQMWNDLVGLLPEEAIKNIKLIWQSGSNHQMAVASVGLLTCITGVLMAGPVRLRRIDAVASLLWLLVLFLYVVECYLKTDTPDWLDAIKFATTSLCCLVGFAAAVATRKPMCQRRTRGRRYLSGSSLRTHSSGQTAFLSGSAAFVPAPPPNLAQLLARQHGHKARRASPSSLPGRLNRALSLGTMPSLARTDSGFLFSGSRPSSQCKESPPSDYFSLKSGSRPSSPGTSPTPSVAGSVASTSSSARQRRPLISPARLNIGGQKLQLFSSAFESVNLAPPPSCLPEPNHFPSRAFGSDAPYFPSHCHDLNSLFDDSSVFEHANKRVGSSSGSSNCHVDTTTGNENESKPYWKGRVGLSLWPGLLFGSLTANLTFISFYLYYNWR
ncbi:transmembrane protein 201 isoform X2 [Electrophorus electricus]|uniref:transmembrane protein 201 isoform X2 n=1 Tax=Electrophorus electricus TaxID=8005 RepID=UPI0015CFE9DC|nr:transmembrane protein 201 isoform X2 [Electrophorus electricus]